MEAKDLPVIELKAVQTNTGLRTKVVLEPYFPDKKMIEPYVSLRIGSSKVKVAVRIQELRNSLTVIENSGDMELEENENHRHGS